MLSRTLTPLLITVLVLQCLSTVWAVVTVSTPHEGTAWTMGGTYDIVYKSDTTDLKSLWQVDLALLGGKCRDSEVCLQDGIVANIAQNYTLQDKLAYTVPTNLSHHGKVW
ncbi:hypothetical protein BG004_005113 [Podila humilis]|nr:hypothetical protein BG004_005113 [Podila humilis]